MNPALRSISLEYQNFIIFFVKIKSKLVNLTTISQNLSIPNQSWPNLCVPRHSSRINPRAPRNWSWIEPWASHHRSRTGPHASQTQAQLAPQATQTKSSMESYSSRICLGQNPKRFIPGPRPSIPNHILSQISDTRYNRLPFLNS